MKNKKSIYVLIFTTGLVYLIFSQDFFSTINIKTLTKRKYVLYECINMHCSGFADRVKGILFAYAIALITDRILIVNVTTPCNLENFLNYNQINWLPNKTNLSNLSKEYFFPNWRGNLTHNEINKIDFISKYKQTDIIVVSINSNLIKHLTMNPAHHARIKQLGFSLDKFNLESVLFQWYKKLFKFTSKMQIRFNKLAAQLKPNKFTKLICAQIRIGGEYGIGFMPREKTKDFWDFIRKTFIKGEKYEFKIFVTSDHSSVIDEAYREFDADKIVAFRNNSFHINFRDSCEDIGNLILDFSLLGLCDMGVVSQSGFGMIGIRNQKKFNPKNYYVYTNPALIKKNFWDRKNQSFYKFDKSLLYIEFNGN